jgi:ABC-type branched-subunit amino acid transport system substrate-binding protein
VRVARCRFVVLALVVAASAAACGASPGVVHTVTARNAAASAGPAASAAGAAGAGGSAAGIEPSAGSVGAGSAVTAPSAASAASGGAAAAPSAASAPSASAAGPSAASSSPGTTSACAAQAPAGGNGGATDTGVTANSIKIGGTFFNGSYLDKYSQVTENAAKAYFQYVNDQGGVCGRKISFTTCDTAGTADGTSGCLSTLADQDHVFAMGPSLDFNLDIVQPFLASHKLPWVGDSGLYPQEFASPWMYPTQISGQQVGALITTYSGNVLKLKKVGISLLNEVAGPACTKRAQAVAQTLGMDASATASNGEVETGLDSQVSTLKNAGVQGVMFCNDPVNTIKFIQAAQRAGWHPMFVGGFVAADDVPLAAGSYASGMYGFTSFDFYNSTTPGIQQYRQITQYYYPNTFHHFYEQASYIGAEAVVAALRKAGPNLTRTSFLAALRSLTDFDTGMGLHLNFANLAGGTASGIMLQADSSLKWHVTSGRFAPAA